MREVRVQNAMHNAILPETELQLPKQLIIIYAE